MCVCVCDVLCVHRSSGEEEVVEEDDDDFEYGFAR
jgi:hypothetical protein